MIATLAPAGPRGNFLTGNLTAYGRDQLQFLSSCARTYGDAVSLRFGPAPVVMFSHPDLIEEVLVRQHHAFTKEPYTMRNLRPMLGNGLFTSEGDFWRRQRRMIQPAFHRERIAAYAAVMVEAAERTVAVWQDGEVRDVQQEMTRLTLAVVAKTLFSADVSGDAAEVGAALTTALELTNGRLNSYLAALLPPNVPTPSNLRLRRAIKKLDTIIYRIIAERRASGAGSGDLLSLLLHAQDEDDGSRMTDAQLRDELMTLFLAGHETTALTLSWAWYLLAQRPEVEAKLVSELQTVLGDRRPTLADLPNLHYADMVIHEALRLYPPAWAVGRVACEDCEAGGYRVPAGTAVIMSQWVVHRDQRFFDRPERFDPDRWADGLAQRLPRFAYFPFGGGPRVCIGNTFAMMEATLVLATIAQRFRLELVPGHPVLPHVAITLRMKHGVRMALHRR